MAFQSTLPIQGETKYLSLSVYCNSISIHSPYTGRDNLEIFRQLKQWHFNPLSLYRERQWLSIRRTQKWTFQSTLPIQGETGIVHNPNRLEKFQSTLPIQGETAILHIKLLIYSQSSYAKRQTKELFPTPTQQIITSLALISSISRCESPCIFMCTSHSH